MLSRRSAAPPPKAEVAELAADVQVMSAESDRRPPARCGGTQSGDEASMPCGRK